jgi:hypothetical protein
MSKRRVYEELRSAIEQRGGRMTYSRAGIPGGVWIIQLDGKVGRFESNGRGFPELDRLYVPLVDNPSRWDDYSKTTIPGAAEKLIALLK